MADNTDKTPVVEASEESTGRVISLEEISKHNTPNDMWMAINGKVYDVTKFVDEHPGGEEVLLDLAGKDATKDFEDVGHSEYAVELLEPLYVGEGDAEELLIRNKSSGASGSMDGSSEEGINVKLVLAAILAVLAGLIYMRATK